MTSISLNFQVHQPCRLAAFQPNDNGKTSNMELANRYFDDVLNRSIFDKVACKCYLPANRTILGLIDDFKHEKGGFKVSYAVTGVLLDACEKYGKDVLETFKQLAESKRVEFLGETYYHSLSSLFETKQEFIEQVNMHKRRLKGLLGVEPKVFINTEMIFNNQIAKVVEDMGFKAIFTEGVERVLGWRSPNHVYARKACFPSDAAFEDRIRVLLRNYRLSDDIGYRFSAKGWDQWPLTADKFASWLNSTHGQCINLFMDYETFGEHHWHDTGIFSFLRALPGEVLKHGNCRFSFPSEIVEDHKPVGEVDVFEFSTVSWADMERDVSAWLGNRMQQICFEELKKLEKDVNRVGDQELKRIWRMLQTSDHLYYCCTKNWNDGDVHKYFSCFATPHDGFANFMGIISDFKVRLINELAKEGKL